jgi:hypothetical protein
MESEGLLPSSRQLATGRRPEPHESRPRLSRSECVSYIIAILSLSWATYVFSAIGILVVVVVVVVLYFFRVHGYRSRGPGLVPGATRFSEKQWVWNVVHLASWVQLRSYLKENVAAPV